MHGKPLFDILSKVPSKFLLHFRCVSKLWREYIHDSYSVSVHDKQVTKDPTPIILSLNKYTLCFHTIESETITNHLLKAKNKVPVFEFVGKKLLNETSKIVGSSNGLVLIETDDPMPTFTVIHPINKQCYVLPKLPLRFNDFLECESCGFGIDSSTNTFKMVCMYHNPNYPNCGASSAHCTMVHVFGTNSWHTIPQVPPDRISGKAIFAHGCLHWLARYHSEYGARQVIWFDVINEEFRLIKPLKRNNIYPLTGHLVNLDGQVGYFGNETMVWLLNDKKDWMLHCDFNDHQFPHDSIIDVLGCLNKDRDILIKVTNWRTEHECIYIYNLKNRVIHEACIEGLDLEDGCKTEIVMFHNSLLDNITNSNLFKTKA